MVKVAERQDEILRILQERGMVTVGELAEQLGASQATLRRDLSRMAEAGLVQRRSGRVDLLVGEGELPIALRSRLNLPEKQRIGRAALDLVQNGETIFISGGTTTLELARLLPSQRRVTAVTNSLRVADVLADKPGISLVVLGGEVRPDERTMHGHLTENGAEELRADSFFYGIHAISPQHGLTHNQLQEVATDRALAASALRVIVLADHTKFGRVAPAMVLPITRVHTIISGCELQDDIAESLRALDIRLILV